jgi:hypothetical protein
LSQHDSRTRLAAPGILSRAQQALRSIVAEQSSGPGGCGFRQRLRSANVIMKMKDELFES